MTEPRWLPTLLAYLGVANLVLGLFNLLPAFPLDGGRLLRAALWAWTGRADRATRVAGRVGSACALGLMGAGLAGALRVDTVSGGWFILLGLFL